MPFKKNKDECLLHCITEHPEDEGRTKSTMLSTDAETHLPSSNPYYHTPVRLFVCSVCGYIEMYSVAVLEGDYPTKPSS
jgi:hypothetical protein